MTTSYAEAAIRRVRSIPPISDATFSIIKLIAKGDYETSELVRIIETDLTLSARCLHMVNSPFYGLRSQVSTIKRAVILLGGITVAHLALQTGLSRMFEVRLNGYGAGSHDLWRHSLRTAIAARQIARLTFSKLSEGLAYTAGLIHDIGKVVISEFLEDESVQERIRVGDMDPDDFLESERRFFGVDHAEVGANIAESWNLPETLLEAIVHHHRPSLASLESQELCLAVHLGDVFSMLAGAGTGLDTMSYALDPMVDRFIKRDADWELKSFPKLLMDIDAEFQEAMELSKMSGGHV